jgi:hypothetical protein
MVAQHFEHDPHDAMTPAEIEKTARSAWEYECKDQNWVGAESRVTVLGTELDVLLANPDALALLMVLRRNHGGRDAPFAVASKAMTAAGVIPGWTTPRRYMAARNWLLDRGFLMRVHKGGRGTGDPDLFTLSSPALGKGAGIAPNITKHPLFLQEAGEQGERDSSPRTRRSASGSKATGQDQGSGRGRVSARLIKGAA